MSGRRRLGVAVVGLGIGKEHARAYVRADTCTLRWLYDLDAGRAAATARELGEGRVAESFDAILGDPAVDIVSIASYDDAHAGQVVAALEAGKHVFVEKPLCRSLDELHTIERAWAGSGGRHLGCNLVLRAAPAFRWLKTAVETGQMGEVFAIDGDYLYGRIEKITAGWRKDVDDYSVMQGGGVHLVDLMLWLTGQRPSSVSALGNRICTRGTAFRYDDYVAATFGFPSSLVGRITANFGGVHRHQHVLRVFGTQASFVHDDLGPRVHTSRAPDDGARPLGLSTLPASKGDLIPDFVDAIVKETDPRPGAEHECRVIAACLAADHAVRTGQPTAIEER
jgi:predicted dehydrogenase